MPIDLKKIKKEIQQSSSNRGEILWFKEGTQYRIRFLTDFEDGVEIPFHKNYQKRIDVPCQEVFGKECAYCDDEDLRLVSMYCWSVFEYESGQRKLLLFAANSCSPVQVLAEAYERYGTLKDRDYDLKQLGSGTKKMFSLFALPEKKFKNTKVKPLSDSAILKIIEKAFPASRADNDDEEEDAEEEYRKTEAARQRRNNEKNKKDGSYMNHPESDDWGEEEEEKDYDSMKPRELYNLCKERKIPDCPQRMSKQFYIDLLEQYDNEESDDWGEEEEDDLPFN